MQRNQKKDGLERVFILELLKRIPVHVFWKDETGKYLGCNDMFAQGLGLASAEAVIGKTDYELPVNKVNGDIYRKDDKLIMDSRVAKLNLEEEQTFPGGKKIHLLTNKIPVFNESEEVVGIIGVYSDITELKKANAKAEVANQAKIEFLENMRHDIRTPLCGIVGCAQLIQMQANNLKNPSKVNEYVQDLVQSSNALLEFLNKILESISVEKDEISVLKKKFNLRDALEKIMRLNQSQATVKNLSLNLEYDETIPVYLIGDPVRVQRIILELVTNALKFTDSGVVKVSATYMQEKDREVVIKLSVSDTGKGIPQDKQHEVYTRFKRLTPSYQGIYPGVGLGLSLVKQCIEDLGAEIYLESEIGKGSEFDCILSFQKPLLMDKSGMATESFAINDEFLAFE